MLADRDLLTDEKLQALVEEISQSAFGKTFDHQARFNSRLRTTGGRYHLGTHNLDFNPKMEEAFGREVLVGIIKHELCHYHLHLTGRGYKHGDLDFKNLLAQVGGLRYAPALEGQARFYHSYQCKACETIIRRKRRFQVDRYRCGRCGGRLVYLGQGRH